MDKRDLSSLFRERLRALLSRSGDNQSAFAAAVGVSGGGTSELFAFLLPAVAWLRAPELAGRALDTLLAFHAVTTESEHAFDTKRQTFGEAANQAVNQTLVRSINTTVVALLPISAILAVGFTQLGPGTLLDLSLALLNSNEFLYID